MISIRDVRESDIAEITAIYAHAVMHGTASYELEPPDEGEMLRRMQQKPLPQFYRKILQMPLPMLAWCGPIWRLTILIRQKRF